MEDLEGVSSLGKAIGKGFDSEIRFLTHCYLRINLKEKGGINPYILSIIGLGNREIIFFREKFTKPFFIIEYNKIKYLTLERSVKYNMMIHLENAFQISNDGRCNEIPYIFIIIPERNLFLESLLYCYGVYYILVDGSMKNLQIKKLNRINLKEIPDPNDPESFIEIKTFRKFYNEPPIDHLTALNSSYR